MKSPGWLRARLLLLVFVAVLPALGLMLSAGLAARRLAADNAQADALRLARAAASNQEALNEGARQLLVALAQMPPVQADAVACSEFLAGLLPQYPLYLNFGVIQANGDLECSALPLTQPINSADRGYFQRAVAARDFAVGDYQVGRITHRSTVNYGYPVLDETGQVSAVIFAALDLVWVQRLAAEVQLPAGATFTMIDLQGTVLARYPDSEEWVGQPLPETPIVQTILAQQGEGTAETQGLDGEARLYAFTPIVSLHEPAAYVAVGVPRSVAFAAADRVTAVNLAGLGAAALLGLAAAWFGSDLLLLRRINALLAATRRIGGGDLSARTGMGEGPGELAQLAHGFDQMAEALEAREAARRQAEKALREGERQLSLVYSNVSDILYYLVVEAEDRFRFLSVNPAFLAATGLREDQVVGKLVQEVIPSPAHELVLGKYTEAIREKKTARWEEVSAYPSGTKYGEVSVTPVFDSTGRCTHLVGTVHDVTERKEAEAQLSRLNEYLERRVEERTAQLAAVNHELEAFAYSVSHDLRAPLRSIDGFSQALLEDFGPKLGDEGEDYLRRVRAAAQRMAALIDDMLALSRVTRAEMSLGPVNLTALARAVAQDLQANGPERAVEFVIAEGLTARGDRGLLRLAVENLLDNAWKFTGRQAQARIEFGRQQRDGRSAFFVRDNGAGFDMEYAHKLFSAFQRLHATADYPGTGVGLATVQRIVRRHGGEVWAEGAVGQGATFYFTLGEGRDD